MSISIHQLKSNLAAMDQTREAANWLVVYADGDDNDERFFMDVDRFKESVREAREDIKEGTISKQFTSNIEGFTMERLIELTDHIERQLADLLRESDGSIELEVCW